MHTHTIHYRDRIHNSQPILAQHCSAEYISSRNSLLYTPHSRAAEHRAAKHFVNKPQQLVSISEHPSNFGQVINFKSEYIHSSTHITIIHLHAYTPIHEWVGSAGSAVLWCILRKTTCRGNSQWIYFAQSRQTERHPNPNPAFPTQCPGLFWFCPPTPSTIPCPLGWNHRCEQMKTTGWKILVDSILVCLRLVSEQWGSFLNHLSCWWNSWTPAVGKDHREQQGTGNEIQLSLSCLSFHKLCTKKLFHLENI